MLRWKVAKGSYVERLERDEDGRLVRTEPRRAKVIDLDEAARLYRAGSTTTEIAERLGCNAAALSRGLRRRGVIMRTGTDYATPVDAELVRRLYVEQRRGLHATARLSGAESINRVRAVLVEMGVEIRKVGRQAGPSRHDGYETEFKRMRPVIARRSAGRCEVRAVEDCQEKATHIHHRKLRSQGGTNTEANLLHVCSRCHLAIHDHPDSSYRLGWLVRSSDDPETIPVQSGEAGRRRVQWTSRRLG